MCASPVFAKAWSKWLEALTQFQSLRDSPPLPLLADAMTSITGLPNALPSDTLALLPCRLPDIRT